MKKIIKLLIFSLFGSRFFEWLQGIYWVDKLKKGEIYEKEIRVLEDFVKEGDVVIDIGANCGQYTYHLSKLVGAHGKVFSVEPAKAALKILKNVVYRLRLANVEIKEVALRRTVSMTLLHRRIGTIFPTSVRHTYRCRESC